MPAINVYTSAEPLPDDKANALLKRLSASLAEHLHKPEPYVMTCLAQRTPMTMGGTVQPSCYAEVKSIGGLAPHATKALANDITAALSEAFSVPPERIYIVYMDIPAARWAHAGETFA